MDTDDLARLAAALVLPLGEAIEDPDTEAVLIGDLGFVLPPGVTLIGSVRPALEGLADAALALEEFDPESGSALKLIARLAPAVRSSMKGVVDLAQSIDAAASGSALVANTDVLQVLPRRLVDYLTADFAERELPLAYALLRVVGIIELRDVVHENDPHRVTFTERILHWDRLPRLASDPVGLIKEQYAWGTAQGVDAESLFERLRDLAAAFGLRSDLRAIDDRAKAAFDLALGGAAAVPTRDAVKGLRVPLLPVPHADIGAEVYPVADSTGAVDGFGIGVYVEGQFTTAIPLSDWLSAQVRLAASDSGFGVVLRTGQEAKLLSAVFSDTPAAVLEGVALDASVEFLYQPPDGSPIVVLGSPDATRVQISSLKLTVGLSKPVAGAPDLFGELALAQLALIVQAGDGDGFLKEVLGDGFSVEFDLTGGFSTQRGLYIAGTVGIDYTIRLGVRAGPVFVERINLKLKSGAPDTRLSITAAGRLELGPLVAVIEDIGLALRIDAARPGVLGNADLGLAFSPPTGLSLSLDTAGFKGGGFLSFDPDNKRYAGVLQLEFKDSIALKAIGLLNTELPGGEPGFSLLIIITAEFQPIQLGLGFTLNGVGGLLGLNRTARIERLRTGIRDNTLSSILFPINPVANANRIISDLREVFPPQAHRFVFGPMAKLGWGTPTLITIDLGLVIEVPEPVQLALLGVLHAVLPDEVTKLLQLQVNFLGVIDFEKQQLAFDASIYDSKLVGYTLSGDMALRLAWGNDPNFLLTVGGFHPAYQPPPLALPALRRLTLQLVSGDNPRLTLQTYFAVTSNTVQFGAQVDLYASAGSFNVSGMLAFDALFQFNPFHVVADVAAKLALCAGSSTIASIKLSLTLEGPTPWKAKGTARLKLCWFLTVKVRFNKTFGEERDTRLDDVAVLPLLQAALQDRQNWRSRLPGQSHLLVTVRQVESGTPAIIAHPVGVLEVSQKVAPLNVRIDRFGQQNPSDGREFHIANVQAEGTSIGTAAVKEFFAPAQFFETSDVDKLAGKSFVKYDSGVGLSGAAELQSNRYAMREVEYELSYIDSQRDQLPPPGPAKPDATAFNTWALNGAIARSPLSFARTGKSALAPTAIRVAQEGYGVVQMSDLTLVQPGSTAPSEAEAGVLMARLIQQQPALAGQIQVVPMFETAGVAP